MLYDAFAPLLLLLLLILRRLRFAPPVWATLGKKVALNFCSLPSLRFLLEFEPRNWLFPDG